MFHVVHISNPFDFEAEAWRRVECSGTVRDAVRVLVDRDDFEEPTICLVDGEPLLRGEWDAPVSGRVVTFIRLAQGIETLIIAAVVAVAAVAVVVAMPKVAAPDNVKAGSASNTAHNATAVGATTPNGAPVYTLQGENNQSRLNAPIECAYGRVRLWPSYAANPYNVFVGNNQYQFSLFCLGVGAFDIHEMYLDETRLSAFEDVTFEIVNPGERFDLFEDNVETATSVANLELFAPNEAEYTGWTNAYVVGRPGIKATRIEVDIDLPNGLYSINQESGALMPLEVQASFQYAEVDHEGNRIGNWQTMLFNIATALRTKPSNKQDFPANASDPIIEVVGVEDTADVTSPADDDRTAVPQAVGKRTRFRNTGAPYFLQRMATATPQRFTLSARVPEGRYQVRAVRMDQKNDTIQAAHTLRWTSLRCYANSVRYYGNTTLVAIRARATNQLNDSVARKFNVVATRRLPVWSAAKGWTPDVPTRNPVWAFCDVFRAAYGGKLADKFLQLDELEELAGELEKEKIHFDYVFDQRSTVWDAAKTVARICRGTPLVQISKITIVRDSVKPFPTAMFNEHNIVAGSFTWSIRLRDVQEHDGLEVEYVDDLTWKRETIVCAIGSDKGDNPKVLKLLGCTDRARAFWEGLYARAVELFITEAIEFKTGLEGLLPRYGDRILVSHDVPRWGTGGFILSVDNNEFQLDREVTFGEGVHKLLFRSRDGRPFGPFRCEATAAPDVVRVLGMSVSEASALAYDASREEPPLFMFGKESLERRDCTVTAVVPDGEGNVTIKAVNYTDSIFAYDSIQPPVKDADVVSVKEPDRPKVTSLDVFAVPGTNQEYALARWNPALGAKHYILQQSADGKTWTTLVTQTDTTYQFRTVRGRLWLRVAGVNKDVGPWFTWSSDSRVPARPAKVQGLRLEEFQPGYVAVKWNNLAHTESFQVTVFDADTGSILRQATVVGHSYTYRLTDAVTDGATSSRVILRVKGINILGLSVAAAGITLDIPPPRTSNVVFTTDSDSLTTDSTLYTTDQE